MLNPYLIPIILLCPNPSLILPKEIILPRTCPGLSTFSTMYVCNNGPLTQRFLITFPKEILINSVKKTYSIPPGKHETLLIQARPNIIGDFTWEITLTFDSGKQTSIEIKSSSIEYQPIYFKDSHINFPDTYLGQTSMRSTQIMNDSDFKVKFQFCAFESPAEDDNIDVESDDSSNLQRCICDRRRFSYKPTTSRSIIPFQSKYFEIVPANGCQFPAPTCAPAHNLQKSFLKAIESPFGGEVSVDPPALVLKTAETAIFHVKYANFQIGHFVVKLRFSVVYGDTLYVTIIGKVETLILHVTPGVVDFGQVPICCRQFQYIRVKNILDCPIRVGFELENKCYRNEETLVSFDEFEAKTPSKMVHTNLQESQRLAPQVSLASYEKDWLLDENTQEYNLPVSGSGPLMLKPLEMQTICLNLVPNWPGVFRTHLKICVSREVDPCKDQPCSTTISILLIHNCVVPDLDLYHTDLIELETYVGQTSSNIIRVKNLDEYIDGFIYGTRYETNEVLINSTPDKEIVPKGMEKNFKITITPYFVGDLEYTYQMYILGNDKPVSVTFQIKSKPVRIKADPKVIVIDNVMPGEISIARFILMNLSPVQLDYQLRISSHNLGRYSIESYDPCLMPYDIVEVEIRQCFDTPGCYEANCWIDINDGYGKLEEVSLQTRVVGVPLMVYPQVEDNLLDLGLVRFDKKPFPIIEFRIENTGQSKYFIIPKLLYDEDLKVDDNRLEVRPGEMQTIEVRFSPKSPKKIKNALFLLSSRTGMIKDYETFKMINFKGKFFKPHVYFSTNDVTLEIKHGDDYDKVGHATIQIDISNMKAPQKFIYTGKPTNFPVEPIPNWCMPVQSYLLDVGDVKLNECKKSRVKFVFHGPGIINACVRVDTAIPGLAIRFLAPEEDQNSCDDNEIPFKFTLKEYLPDPPKGRYALERSRQDDPLLELTHAHSYDFTNRLVHVRKSLNLEEKTKIKEHYSHVSAMHGKNKVRDPNTYAEIFQETSRDATGQIFGILLEFQPNLNSFGKKYLELHEILHLDIHLGSSVPLHFHARVNPRDPNACACLPKVEILTL